MRLFIRTVLPLLCLAFVPAVALGQQNLAFAFEPSPPAAADVHGNSVVMSLPLVQEPNLDKPEEVMGTSGFFLGVIGMLGGAAVGGSIGSGDCPSRDVDKGCMGRHAYTGALIAGTALVPLGVHLANKDRRNLLLSMAVSTALGVGLYYGMKAIPGSPIAMAPFVAAPLQVVTSVRIEQMK